VPLNNGIEDEQYRQLFEPIMEATISKFRPNVIVLQCGADSLRDDRIGLFNLSYDGHAACVEYIKKFNLPMIVLGGGGYTIKNVARCWANETAVLVGEPISNEIPVHEYFDYYGPHYLLRSPAGMRPVANQNTKEYLEKVKEKALEQLRHLDSAPSVQMNQVPDRFEYAELERLFGRKGSKREAQAELYDSAHDVDATPMVLDKDAALEDIDV